MAFASSLDQIGPITKDVRDCATLLNLIAGHDEKIQHQLKLRKRLYKSIKNDVKGLKIAVPKEFFGEGINAEVKRNIRKSYRNIQRTRCGSRRNIIRCCQIFISYILYNCMCRSKLKLR